MRRYRSVLYHRVHVGLGLALPHDVLLRLFSVYCSRCIVASLCFAVFGPLSCTSGLAAYGVIIWLPSPLYTTSTRLWKDVCVTLPVLTSWALHMGISRHISLFRVSVLA